MVRFTVVRSTVVSVTKVQVTIVRVTIVRVTVVRSTIVSVTVTGGIWVYNEKQGLGRGAPKADDRVRVRVGVGDAGEAPLRLTIPGSTMWPLTHSALATKQAGYMKCSRRIIARGGSH